MVRKNANAGAGASGARQGFPKQNRPADNSHSTRARQASAQSWRDVLPIHPAAELFPRMSPDELRVLGEDIKNNGLRCQTRGCKGKCLYGRSRLDGMELVGLKLELWREDKNRFELTASGIKLPWSGGHCELKAADDPYAYVSAANTHRRHLSAE